MKKITIIILAFLFVCLGTVDLVTTVYGFSLGLIESDGIFIPFGFTVISIIYLLISGYLVNKKIIHNYAHKFIIGWLSIMNCFPVINNLLLIGSVIQ